MSQGQQSNAKTGGLHKQMLVRLLVIVVAMFGFGYALVPIYKAICEITGINVLTPQTRDADEIVKNTQVDTSRTIEVIFDANERGKFQFKPETNRMKVHPGELVTMNYVVYNNLPNDTAGQAIPSYLPSKAAAHFTKLECFCFKQQPFKAGEQKEFPVVFVINPELPKDVHTITLSYTFFEVAGATAMSAQ
ncbi:MAG TPA: cytochrome c oxidase assembly protein [Limnobacter sp.]|nr:cytochrome c oxidase assembly protein [Limnobacter sp.]